MKCWLIGWYFGKVDIMIVDDVYVLCVWVGNIVLYCICWGNGSLLSFSWNGEVESWSGIFWGFFCFVSGVNFIFIGLKMRNLIF